MNWLIPLKCPNCGKTINENDKYCLSCGTDLEEPVEKDIVLAKKYFEKAQWKYDKGLFLTSALKDCELAIQYNSDSAEIYNLYGLLLDALGRTEEAIFYYKKAIHLDPSSKDAKDNLYDAETEQNINLLSDLKDEHVQSSTHKNSLFSVLGSVYVILSILIVATIVGWQFYKFIYPYLIPKTEIILVPDISEQISIEQTDLELAASILTQRAQILGYSQVTFVVVENNHLLGRIPVTVNVNDLLLEIGKVGLLEFVDFGKTVMLEGEEITTDFETKYYFSKGVSKVWHTVMTNNEIANATTFETQFQVITYQINLSLTDDGAQIFSKHTTENIGSYLGIVLDKIIISSPIINEPISGNQVTISGSFTKEGATELASILKTQALPFPIKLKE